MLLPQSLYILVQLQLKDTGVFIIADIDDVNKQLRTAFSRVKDDVTDIRESLSEQLSKIDGMNKNLERYTTKDEFYAFIKKLMQRLDDLETGLVKPKELHDVEDTTRARFLDVNERIKQLQALSKDVENLKALKEKVSSIEGSSLDKSDFKKTEKRLDDDIGALQELQSQYEKLEKKSTSTEKRVKELEEGMEEASRVEGDFNTYKKTADRQLVENAEITKSGLDSLSEELAKIKKLELDQALGSLRSDLLELKEKTATSKEVDETNAKLREEIREVRSELRKTGRKVDSLKARREAREQQRPNMWWIFLAVLAVIAIIVIAAMILRYRPSPKETIIMINITNMTEGAAENVTNVTPIVTPVVNETNLTVFVNGTLLQEKNESCILKYECLRADNETVYFDCYYDPESDSCRCFTGGNESCNVVKLRLLQLRQTLESAIPKPQFQKLALKYGIALVVVLILILAWIYYAANKKNNK